MPLTITFAASMPADTDLIATGRPSRTTWPRTPRTSIRGLSGGAEVSSGGLDQHGCRVRMEAGRVVAVGLGPRRRHRPAACGGPAAQAGAARHAEVGDHPARVDPEPVWPAPAQSALAEGVGARRLPLSAGYKTPTPRSTGSVEVTSSGRGGQRVGRGRRGVPASPRPSRWPVTWSTRPADADRSGAAPSVAVEIAEREGLAVTVLGRARSSKQRLGGLSA